MEPVNYYEKIPKEMRKVYHNPGFKKHGLNVPFRMLVVGASGAGKTNWLMNMIKMTSGTFEHIIVCLKSRHEPLYEFLAKKLPNSVTFYENQVPAISELEQYSSSLAVFDDLVATKSLQPAITDYFVRGRKHGISMVYISQSYYGIPKTIRSQATYIVLKKLTSDKDLALVLREYSFNMDFESVMDLYEKATATKNDFLMIDLEGPNDKKWRYNWKPIVVKKRNTAASKKKNISILDRLMGPDPEYE